MEEKTAIIRKNRSRSSDYPMQRVATMLRTLRYGSITLVVQDGRVLQLNRMEKQRLTPSIQP